VSCDHYTTRRVKHGFRNDDGDWEVVEDWESISLNEDIDTHRYKCKGCGKVGYYSYAAQQRFERGVKSSVEGLE
jgi:hypothetical protein